MPSFGDLLGSASDEGRQLFLWGVLLGVIQAATQPFQRDLTYLVNETFPNQILGPPDLVDAVLKGWLSEDDASATAKKSGVSPDDFSTLVKTNGEPPGLQDVLLWFRRGKLPWSDDPGKPSVVEAIRTSRIHTSTWEDSIKAAATVPLGVADAVDAVVEGQISFDQGAQIAYENGITADDFKVLYNTRGNPPGPADLIELVRRGFIPLQGVGPEQTTLQQGIFEGATKDKWEPFYEKLVDYLPPPRTVTALQRAGSLSPEQAQALYQAQGLSPDLAAAYVANASTDKVAAHKQLAESVVLALYRDAAVDGPTATAMLGNLGYDPGEAAFILSVQDLQRQVTATDSAITRVGTLYIARKIDAATAQSALGTLGCPGAQITALLDTWTLERDNTVKLLTESQIVDAWDYGSVTFDDAMTELQGIGYSAHDAWVLIANKNKGTANIPPDPGLSPFPSGNVT